MANKFYHSPPDTGMRGAEYLLRAATDLSVQTVSAVCAGEKIPLFPEEEAEGLRFWRGTLLPLPDAREITYTFYADLSPVGTYTAELREPDLPVIAITELYLRDKHNCTPYVEIVNTTGARLDLGGYQLLWKTGGPEDDGEISALPLAQGLGRTILPPRSTALLWLAFPEAHTAKVPCETPADFCARFSHDHAWRDVRLSPDEMQIVRIEASEQREDGTWQLREGIASTKEIRPWKRMTFGIALLGGDMARAICRVTINNPPPGTWRVDTQPRRASLWQPTAFGGKDLQRIAASADATPGVLGRRQMIPDLKRDTPLCIVPLDFPRLHPLGDGALTLRWLVRGGAVRASRLTVDGVCMDAECHDGVWSLTLPVERLARLERLDFSIEADNGTYLCRLQGESVTLLDNAGPTVTAVSPENGYAAFVGDRVSVKIAYYDRSGVDTFASHLYLDGMEISHRAVWTEESVSVTLDAPKRGKHKLALKLYDCLGNASRTVSYFSVADRDALVCWRGEVHSHTADSDGVGSAADAMTYARNVGGADYFAVTDHSHYMTADAYSAQRENADSFNAAGKFAALYGWEMTWNNECGYWGHMNVLADDTLHHDIRSMDLPGLFDYLAERPQTVAMFNHPCDEWGDFDEFAHRTPERDAIVCLDEIRGWRYDPAHRLALSRGWHVAPVSNEDNHAFSWTTATAQTGVVLAPALTRQNVLEAMRARRTYTTSDATLRLRFRINGAWLGSRIPATDRLTVDFALDTEREAGIGLIRLVGEHGITVAEWDVGAARHAEKTLLLPPEHKYYYLKMTNPLVEGDYTVSAPVWIEGRDALVANPELSLTGGDKPNLVGVKLENRADRPMSDLRADFYLTGADGFCIDSTEPYCTVYPDAIPAGGSVRIARAFPHLPGRRRVTVVVRGRAGKRCYTDIRYLMLTPVSVAEVLPYSTDISAADGKRVSNPFAYVVLFNRQNTPLSLDGARLCLWTKTGKKPLPAYVYPLDGTAIAARSAAVFWICPKEAALTGEDFNRHYGTALTEGEDLFILRGTHFSSGKNSARRLDLVLGEETVSRVYWNYAADFGKQPTVDRALRYGYRGGLTLTSVLLDDAAEPHPGQLTADQLPSARMLDIPLRELCREKKAKRKAQKAVVAAERKIGQGAAAAIGVGAAALGAAVGVGGALLGAFVRRKGKK